MEDANLEGISMKYILAIKESGLVPSFAFSSQKNPTYFEKQCLYTLVCTYRMPPWEPYLGHWATCEILCMRKAATLIKGGRHMYLYIYKLYMYLQTRGQKAKKSFYFQNGQEQYTSNQSQIAVLLMFSTLICLAKNAEAQMP